MVIRAIDLRKDFTGLFFVGDELSLPVDDKDDILGSGDTPDKPGDAV
jgi:hypothetical protein